MNSRGSYKSKLPAEEYKLLKADILYYILISLCRSNFNKTPDGATQLSANWETSSKVCQLFSTFPHPHFFNGDVFFHEEQHVQTIAMKNRRNHFSSPKRCKFRQKRGPDKDPEKQFQNISI